MKFKKFFFILVYLLLPAGLCISQEDVLRPVGRESDQDLSESRKIPLIIGLELGLNYNMFSQNLSWTPIVNNSPWKAFESGAGASPFFGLLIDIGFSKKFGIQVKFNYDPVHFSNNYTGDIVCDDLTPGRGNLDYSVDGDYYALSFLFRYNLNENFFVTLGPVISLASGNLEQTTYFKNETPGHSADNIVNAIKLWEHSSTEEKTMNGIEAGIGYKFNFSRNWWLVPRASFLLNFNKIADDYVTSIDRDISQTFYGSAVTYTDRMLHKLKLGLALWYGF